MSPPGARQGVRVRGSSTTSAHPPPTVTPSPDGAPSLGVPPHRQLRRSTTNKVLGGVCGGLAEYTGVEALLWRIGFVALAFFGAGILVYPLLWILLPAGT